MNLLFISLLALTDRSKGDFKVLSQRTQLASRLGHKATVLLFKLTLFSKKLISSSPSHSLLPGSSCILTQHVPLIPILWLWPLLLTTVILEKLPLHTLYSLYICLLLDTSARFSFKNYSQVHFFHIRLAPLFLSTSNECSNVRYELIDSYSLNLNRRLARLSVPFYLLPFFLYEYHSISNLERRLLNFRHPNLRFSFVSRVDSSFHRDTFHSPSTVPLFIVGTNFIDKISQPKHHLTLAFFGNLNYFPNIDAVHTLLSVLSRSQTEQQLPPLKLIIGGRSPSIYLRLKIFLYSIHYNVSLTSPVPDMQSFVRSADLCVFPLTLGSGLQSKLIEAISWSIPVIASHTCVDALSSTLNSFKLTNIHTASSPDEVLKKLSFAAQTDLYSNSQLYEFHQAVINGLSIEKVESIYLDFISECHHTH